MDYRFSNDQELIRKSVRDFLERECPKDKTRELVEDRKGYDPKMWERMVQLGFMGLIIPEEYEGTGLNFVELAIFMEEVGRNIVPSPFFPTICLCAPAILEYGNEKQKRNILPQISEKGEIWTPALHESRGGYAAEEIQLTVTVDGDDFLLNGTKLFVPYANSAKNMLVAARTDARGSPEDGITVFMVPTNSEGIEAQEIPTSAPGVKCEVKFNHVRVSGDNVLGGVGAGWQVIDHMIQNGAVLVSAEMVGGARAALDLAVAYAKQRVQFNRVIGSFQALQHRLVNMLVEVDTLWNQVYEAAWNISVATSSRYLNSMVKARANDVYYRVCFDAIAVHGAIGWTEEMDVSLYLRRTKELENECGGTCLHKERVARELEIIEPAFRTILM